MLWVHHRRAGIIQKIPSKRPRISPLEVYYDFTISNASRLFLKAKQRVFVLQTDNFDIGSLVIVHTRYVAPAAAKAM